MKKLLSLMISFCIIFFAGCQNETTNNHETNVTDIEYNSAPFIISATVDELRAIKNAANTMQEDEFAEYMYKNHYGAIANGMNTTESTKSLVEEFEATIIPMLDREEKGFNKLLFYHERNEIQCVIPYTESVAMTFNIYTPKSDRKESDAFGTNNSEAVLQKEFNFDNVLVSVYKTETPNEFFVDVFADNTYIFVRTTGIADVEEFEECFSRLEFRKIGDLLNEMPEEISSADKTEAETTLQDEAETDITTNISEETTFPESTEAVTTG